MNLPKDPTLMTKSIFCEWMQFLSRKASDLPTLRALLGYHIFKTRRHVLAVFAWHTASLLQRVSSLPKRSRPMWAGTNSVPFRLPLARNCKPAIETENSQIIRLTSRLIARLNFRSVLFFANLSTMHEQLRQGKRARIQREALVIIYDCFLQRRWRYNSSVST